ncbi:hypothetical protein CS006_09875 [Bifidobacterium primatium]|uniref:Serine aminopeptidase S33 domain-containing protein n=1 Tax=Bifidobacterium primatium TaxID=2045438 RepID=A0A2M9H6I9_9BIFI|nr:hypothetical protein CS006_09875 [Bifidobacterium primatium]
MELQLIDEHDYARTMTETVLPALAACRSEGWMEPSHDADLAPLDSLQTAPTPRQPKRGTPGNPIFGEHGELAEVINNAKEDIKADVKANTIRLRKPNVNDSPTNARFAEDANVGAGNTDRPAVTNADHTGQLHYVCYDAAKFDAVREHGATATFRGAVVISHGFTEFAERFAELAWYLLLDGFSVCILEHRGHGYSPRDVADESLVWIDDWHRYVDDLAKFCSTIGQDYALGSPLYLYGHSMGGGIAAAMLERYPTIIDKAVLSAPMIAPKTGMPLWLSPWIVELACAVGLSKHIAPTQQYFSEDFDEQFYRGLSLPRARWVHDLRVKHPEYHTNAATFGWVREGLRMYRSVLRPAACAEVEAPLLVFQADNDSYVLPQPQNRFVSLVRAGGCPAQLVHLRGSRHEMTTERNEIMRQYVGRILEFLHTPLAEE